MGFKGGILFHLGLWSHDVHKTASYVLQTGLTIWALTGVTWGHSSPRLLAMCEVRWTMSCRSYVKFGNENRIDKGPRSARFFLATKPDYFI